MTEIILSNYQCFTCNSNCQKCSANYYISCNKEYYLSTNNSCVQCSIPWEESSNENKSSKCTSGYFLLSDKCYQYNIYCNIILSDNCKCFIWYEGYLEEL